MKGIPGADPGFLKGGGVHLRSTSKKRGGGGPRGGATLGPMLKSLHRGPKRGGSGPPAPPLDPLLDTSFLFSPSRFMVPWSY